MPLKDSSISKEPDGIFNEEYCKWCYSDGEFKYDDMDVLIAHCVSHMEDDRYTEQDFREGMRQRLSKLNYWKKYSELGGEDKFEKFKQTLIDEFNALNIEGMPEVKNLNALVGQYVNMPFTLPSGRQVRFLDDNVMYLGNELESEFGGERCFGIIANMDFLLVCTYSEGGNDPELVVYKKR